MEPGSPIERGIDSPTLEKSIFKKSKGKEAGVIYCELVWNNTRRAGSKNG